MPHGKNIFPIKRITVCGMLIASAVVLGFIEGLIPLNFGFAGFKLGLANIVVLFALYKLKSVDAIVICILKILICGLAFGGPVYIFYSLSGGLLSFLIMLLLKNKLHIITVSILGAVFFNIGQVLCAVVMFSTVAIIYTYLPLLMLAGVITGSLIGFIADIAIKRIKI